MERRANFTGLAPQFVVADPQRTAEFYRDKLGFKILGLFMDPPVFAIVRRGNAEIHFGKADGERTQTNNDVRKGLGTDAYIFVDDIEAVRVELAANGVDIVEGPIKRVYNCVEITIKDCNGFQIVFGA